LESAQCFDLPGERTFGPSQWHIDISKDGYRKKWEASIAAVVDGSANPKAAMLVLSAIENLMACAEYANSDMEQRLGKPDTHETYQKLFPTLQPMVREFLDRLHTVKDSLHATESLREQ
jgi:hypothetical protein